MGVVETPRGLRRVVMVWFIWTMVYLVGMLLAIRYYVLKIQDKIDRENHERLKDGQTLLTWWNHDSGPLWIVIFGSMFWFLIFPLSFLYQAGKFLIFPRGVKSRFAREQELIQRRAKADRAAIAELKHFQELESQVRSFSGMSSDLRRLLEDQDRIARDRDRAIGNE